MRRIALVSVICVEVLGCGPLETFQHEYELFQSIKVGMHEKEVVDILGKPIHVYEKDNAPEWYYVDGYSYEKRPHAGRRS